MKLFLHLLPIAALALLLAPAASAEESRGTIIFEFDGRDRAAEARPAEARRIPAEARVRNHLTPYTYAGFSGVLVDHEEVSTSVLSLHIVRERTGAKLRAGHSLAPNLSRITAE